MSAQSPPTPPNMEMMRERLNRSPSTKMALKLHVESMKRMTTIPATNSLNLRDIENQIDYAENLLRGRPSAVEESRRFGETLLTIAGVANSLGVAIITGQQKKSPEEEVNWKRDGF